MMQTTTGRWAAFAIAAALMPVAAPSPGADLGDPAAPLQVAEWAKHGPIDLAQGKGKTVYVIEFWATWCPPCRQTIPHLTQLRKEFKDKGVEIIGVSDEKADTVKGFVTQMGDAMDYPVAIDDGGATSKAYMGAFGVSTIPHAFIVNKEGKVVWVGHPMDDLGGILTQVLAGTYDIERAKRAAAREKALMEKRTAAMPLLDEYLKLVGADASAEDNQKSAAVGDKVLETVKGDTEIPSMLAWAIMNHKRIAYRDLKLALRAAEAAHKAAEEPEAGVLRSYARALFENGRPAEAVTYQKQAIEALAKDDPMREDFSKDLEKYQAAPPPQSGAAKP